MMRFASMLVALTLATGVPAGAQSPAAHPTPAAHANPTAHAAAHTTATSSAYSKKIQVNSFSNPGQHGSTPGVMSGSGCQTGGQANRAATTVNPVNGHPGSSTVVAIPIGKGSGSVANATTRQQQAEACAHTR